MVLLISWDNTALTAFEDAMEFIARDSYTAAIKVSAAIDEAISKAAHRPFSNPPDKYREDSDERFRAFELFNFRISYYATTDELVVLRFRHARQLPITY